MRGQEVTELLHLLIIHPMQWDVWNLVETDEVDTAVEPLQELDDRLGMLHTVVHTLEDDILERETTLVREVIVAQQLHYLLDAHSLLGWHQLRSLGWYRVMETDGYMALTLLQESFQLVLDAHRADRDTLRTPCPTIIGSQYLRGTKHIVEVVHRLALSHKHDVGQVLHLRQRVYLVEDVARRQTPLKSLLARLTEETVHLASHLRGDAKGGTVLIRNIDGLHKLAASSWEEVLDGTIHRVLCIGISCASYFVFGSQFGTVGFREIGHFIDALHMLHIEPLGNLPTGESRHSQVLRHLLQFSKGKTQKIFFFVIHTAKIRFFGEKVLSLPHILI